MLSADKINEVCPFFFFFFLSYIQLVRSTSMVPGTFSMRVMVPNTIGMEAKKSVMNSLDITLFLLRVLRNGTS